MIEYVEIRNTDRELIGIIDTAASIIWESSYYGTGRFEIYVQVTQQTVALLSVGNYVTRPNDVNVGVIENLNIKWEPSAGRMIIASGRFAKSLLDRRLIYDYKNYSITPTVSKGLVEVAVRNLIYYNAISSFDQLRNIPGIWLGELKNIQKQILTENGTPGQIQTSFGGLLEYTDSLLQEYELGAYMSFDRDSKLLLYNIHDGRDFSIGNAAGNAPIIFSQDFDNLLSSDYKYETTALKTTALIGGEGEGIGRFFTMIGHQASGLSRREVFIDASSQSKTYKIESTDESGNVTEGERQYFDAEYDYLLQAFGQQNLAQLQIVQTFDGDIDIMNSNKVFGKDFWIGDIITIQDVQISAYINTRILTATEVQDQSGYKLVIKYGV